MAWSIDASILNILWADLWPRLMAQGWKTGNYPIPFGHVDPAVLAAAVGVLAERDKETRPPNPAVGDPGWVDGDLPVTRFQRRVRRVQDYLRGLTADVGVIPINFVGECGYEFVLSNCGLDLFAPEPPVDAFDLCRFYSFRRTGRANLGVPTYLDDPHVLTFAVDAPTGAGQVFTSPQAMADMLICGVHRLGELECLRWEEVQPGHVHGWREGGYVRFSFVSYTAAVGRLRHWQLEGSVYLAMTTELPRIVANIWMERDPGGGGPGAAHSYHHRWINGRVRRVFEERIEASLPNVIGVGGPGLVDIRISDAGIEIPPLGDGQPQLPDMLDAIIAGKAGNPVFTDSKRPGGEE